MNLRLMEECMEKCTPRITPYVMFLLGQTESRNSGIIFGVGSVSMCWMSRGSILHKGISALCQRVTQPGSEKHPSYMQIRNHSNHRYVTLQKMSECIRQKYYIF
jgi:hypothetical protein